MAISIKLQLYCGFHTQLDYNITVTRYYEAARKSIASPLILH